MAAVCWNGHLLSDQGTEGEKGRARLTDGMCHRFTKKEGRVKKYGTRQQLTWYNKGLASRFFSRMLSI